MNGYLAGLFALGIFTRRTNATGALCGAAGGALVLYLVQQYTHVHFFLYAAIGITVCFTVGYLASLILPSRTKDLAGLTVYRMKAEGGRRKAEV